jgi:hypothetical protein
MWGQAEECLRTLEMEIALGRQRLSHAETVWRSRDREVERLQRQLESRSVKRSGGSVNSW